MKLTLYLILIFSLFMLPTGPSWARVQISPHLTIAEEYTDNLYLTDDNKEDDWITTAEPGIGLSYAAKALELNLDYLLRFRFYQNHTGENEKKIRDIQRAVADGLFFPGRDFQIFADGDISQVSVDDRGPDVEESDLVNNTNQYRFAVNPQYRWSPSAKFSTTLGYRYEQYDYDYNYDPDDRFNDESDGGDDSKSNEYSLQLENTFSANTDLLLRYSYLNFQQNTFQDFNQQTLTAGFVHRFGPRLTLSADGGVVKIDYSDSSDNTSSIWSGIISYAFSEALSVDLSYQKAFTVSVDSGQYESEDAYASLIYAGRATFEGRVYWSDDKYQEENREDKSIGSALSLTVPLVNKFYASAFCEYEYSKYRPDNEKVDYYGAGTRVGYELNRLDVSLAYTYRANDSDINVNDYRNNQVILTGSLRY